MASADSGAPEPLAARAARPAAPARAWPAPGCVAWPAPGRGWPALGCGSRRCGRGQPAGHRGGQVLHVRQPQQERAGIDLQPLAERREHVLHPGRRVRVLLGVLGRREQRGAERLVLRRVPAPRGGAGQHERADLGRLAADQQLRGRAHHAAAGEGVAVRVAGGQPVQQRAHVDIPRGGSVKVPGQHGLAQAGPDGGDRGGHGLLPLRRGQAAVVPAHLTRRAHRGARAQVRGRPDRRQPGAPAPAAEDGPRQHHDGSVGGRVEGEAAERDRARAGHIDLVLGGRGVQQRAEPLLGHGEPVLAGRQRDPGRLAPADQALAVPHPRHRGGLRQPADQVARILDGGRADDKPVGH